MNFFRTIRVYNTKIRTLICKGGRVKLRIFPLQFFVISHKIAEFSLEINRNECVEQRRCNNTNTHELMKLIYLIDV